MTTPLQPLPIRAPATFGLNTEEAAGSIDPRWALELTNAVFDSSGRAAARNGWAYSTDSGNRHSADTEAIFEFLQDDGTKWIVSAAGTALYTSYDAGSPAAPDLTDLNTRTGSNAPTDAHWKFVNYNGSVVGFQAGHIPQYLTAITTAATNFADITTGSGPGASDADWGNSGLAAFGRLWATDDTETVLYWSELLGAPNSGTLWSGGGSLDTSNVWPDGLDRIVALAEWQNRLLIFGSRSILIYKGDQAGMVGLADPAADLDLEDIITASGCVARDSVVSIGTDLVYLARDGLRSLARGIQFSTLPLQQLSRPIRQRLIEDIQDTSDANDIKCAYSRRHALYVARIGSHYWAFDVRAPLERGELRASRWEGMTFKSLASADDGTLYLGQNGGVGSYTGYQDNGSSYQFRYRSTWLEPQAGITVIPKYALVLVDTPGAYLVSVRYAFDFVEDYEVSQVQLPPARSVAEWNVGTTAGGTAEWGTGEWSGGATTVKRVKVPLGRHGDRVQLGVSVNVDGSAFALLRMDVFTKVGRLAA